MIRALFLSLRVHLLWFLDAFSSTGRLYAPMGWRRLAVLLLVYPLFLLLQAFHWLGILLDEIFFRGYRDVIIKEPLIITGIPRSGMTYIPRAIAANDKRFTAVRSWEAVLSPSITERRLCRFLARLDRMVGAPLYKLLARQTRRLSERLKNFHDIGLHSPEEDYLTLLPAGGCLLMCLLFPASLSLWQLGRFYEYPEREREILLQFYRAMLQKHMHEAGPGKRLVSKNAVLGSWLPDMRYLFPDARFLYCVREPHVAITSQANSLQPMLEFLGTAPALDLISQQLQTIFAHNYRIILEEKESFLIDRLAIIDYEEWRLDPEAILTRALTRLCVTLSPELMASVRDGAAVTARHQSRNPYRPDTRTPGPNEYRSLIGRIHAEILEHPCHIRPQLDRQ